ncbi:MAG TPA: hypothetical protein VK970_21895 [Candidatus Methylacidiphilales bacterium]|nr:hypothetical protein [Candidatus Methylacidiphilales bacterium]
MTRQLLNRWHLHNMLKADALEKGNRVWDISVITRERVFAGPFYSTDQLARKLSPDQGIAPGVPDGWIVDKISPDEWRLYLRVGENYTEQGRRFFDPELPKQPSSKSIHGTRIAIKSEQEYVRLVALQRDMWWQAPFVCPYCETVWWDLSRNCSHLVCQNTRVLEGSHNIAFQALARSMRRREWSCSIQNSPIDGLTIKLPRRDFCQDWFRHAWWYVQKVSTLRRVEAAMLESHQTQIIVREDIRYNAASAQQGKTLVTRKELSDQLLATLKRGGERVWEGTVHMGEERMPMPHFSTSRLAGKVLIGGPQYIFGWGSTPTQDGDTDGWFADQPAPGEWRLYLRHAERCGDDGSQRLQATMKHTPPRPDHFIRLLALPREMWWQAPFVCPCCQTLHADTGSQAASCEHLLAAEDVVAPAYADTRFAALLKEMWQMQWTCGIQNASIEGFRIKIARVHRPGEWFRTAYWYIRDPSILPLLEAYMAEARRVGTPAALPPGTVNLSSSPASGPSTPRKDNDGSEDGDEDEDDDGFDVGGLVLA